MVLTKTKILRDIKNILTNMSLLLMGISITLLVWKSGDRDIAGAPHGMCCMKAGLSLCEGGCVYGVQVTLAR
jgi:hypothetical protein